MSSPLSIIIPVFNEEDCLRGLAEELRGVAARLPAGFEVVFVDDGSRDGSWKILEEVCAAEPAFKSVRLGRNFGQTAAIQAGIDHSTGALLAFMDADLQNDPADLPKLLAKLDEGFDVVSGWRRKRQDVFLTRRLPSNIANWIIGKVTGVPLHDYGCTLKVYRREFLAPVRLIGEMHRFMPAFAGFLGARIAELEVNHRARTMGVSKYGLGRIPKVLLDLLTVKFLHNYLSKPIYFFGGWGLTLCGAGGVMALITLYYRFCRGIFVKDQPLLQVSIFFLLVGIMLIMIGLLAEIMNRTYMEVHEGSGYAVREKAGF